MLAVKILLVTILVTVFGGCASLNIPRPRVETAAAMDVVTTYVGLEMGGTRELNPLGFGGTNLAKLYYLYVLRPGYSPEHRREMDRRLSSVFVGAAVNNTLQLVTAPSLWLSLAAGVLVGFSAYWTEEEVAVVLD